MPLHSVPRPDYRGEAGIAHLTALRQELVEALRDEDWHRVRDLDRACAGVINRVVAANREDGTALVRALSELKGVYSNLIDRCQREVMEMAL